MFENNLRVIPSRFPESIFDVIRRRAARNHRTIQGEVRFLVDFALEHFEHPVVQNIERQMREIAVTRSESATEKAS